MNVLICQLIGSYIDPDVIDTLKSFGYGCDEYPYDGVSDIYNDEEFMRSLEKKLDAGKYGFVYSTDYYPVIAKVCFKKGIRYISWVYDSPPNLPTEETMEYETNSIFFFCRYDYLRYKNMGFDTVYHMPLAVNAERLDRIKTDHDRFDCEVSFVGRLYDSTLPILKAHMNEEQQRYLDAVIAVQVEKNGSEVIEAAVNDDFIEGVNAHYRTLSDKPLQPTRRQVIYSLCEHLTHLDRLALLRLTSRDHEVVLYTGDLSETDKRLLLDSNVKIKGRVDYKIQMPQVFKCSKINLNPTVRANNGGIALRCLDVMASGGFLLSNYQVELDEQFSECGLVMYDSYSDALSKIDYYLKNEDERVRVINNCREKVKEEFGYKKRIGEILKISGIDR